MQRFLQRFRNPAALELFAMDLVHRKKLTVRRRVLCFVVAAVILAAVLDPAGADSPQDDGGFEELVGTWIYTEYDGLVPYYEEITWKADGTLLIYDSHARAFRSEGPFAAAGRRIGAEGDVTLVLVGQNDPRAASLLVKTSRCGDRCEIYRIVGGVCNDCRCFFRKKLYRGKPRYRFDFDRRKQRYAFYPFKPDRVMPWTKYFWAKA